MGFFGMGKSKQVVTTTPDTSSATEEKEATKKKARMVETEGGNKGAELQANQGQSVRKIFGN